MEFEQRLMVITDIFFQGKSPCDEIKVSTDIVQKRIIRIKIWFDLGNGFP